MEFDPDTSAESAHELIPKVRPREQVFLDEFIGVVIRIMRLDGFECHIAHQLPPEQRVTFKLEGYNPKDETEYLFDGHGPSMGHALRSILDQIAEAFGLEKDAL